MCYSSSSFFSSFSMESRLQIRCVCVLLFILLDPYCSSSGCDLVFDMAPNSCTEHTVPCWVTEVTNFGSSHWLSQVAEKVDFYLQQLVHQWPTPICCHYAMASLSLSHFLFLLSYAVLMRLLFLLTSPMWSWSSAWAVCGWNETSPSSSTMSLTLLLTPGPPAPMWTQCTPANVSSSSCAPSLGACWGKRPRFLPPRRSVTSSSNRWILLVSPWKLVVPFLFRFCCCVVYVTASVTVLMVKGNISMCKLF